MVLGGDAAQTLHVAAHLHGQKEIRFGMLEVGVFLTVDRSVNAMGWHGCRA
jgi:hypothetical protein